MKHKILYAAAVLAVAAVVAWNVNLNSQTKGMSDIMLANVEALADENGTDSDSDSGSNYSCTITQPCPKGETVSCTGQACRFVEDDSKRLGVECDAKATWCRK